MNKVGAGPNLTMLMIGLAVFLTVFMLSYGVYDEIMSKNGGYNNYSSQYEKIGNYQSNLTSFENSISSNKSMWQTVPEGLSSTFNVLIIGVGGVITFFEYATVLPVLFEALSEGGSGLGIPKVFISLITFSLTVFFIMKVYKAIRNSPEEP